MYCPLTTLLDCVVYSVFCKTAWCTVNTYIGNFEQLLKKLKYGDGTNAGGVFTLLQYKPKHHLRVK